jgi:hypothetical protein
MMVPASAGDRSSPFLKGVKIVSYKLSVEPPNKGRCAIDLKAWNTAIDPVANQSTKLKLIRDADHLEQEKQLSDELRKTSENVERHLTDPTAEREHDEAEERWKKFLLAPTLSFSVLTTDLGVGCAGTLSVEVIVGLEPSKIIATDAPVQIPLMIIWSDHQLLSAPYETFSSFAIQTSEQTLKRFADDWTKSQEDKTAEFGASCDAYSTALACHFALGGYGFPVYLVCSVLYWLVH